VTAKTIPGAETTTYMFEKSKEKGGQKGKKKANTI
jgi:hypothetical protein